MVNPAADDHDDVKGVANRVPVPGYSTTKSNGSYKINTTEILRRI